MYSELNTLIGVVLRIKIYIIYFWLIVFIYNIFNYLLFHFTYLSVDNNY